MSSIVKVPTCPHTLVSRYADILDPKDRVYLRIVYFHKAGKGGRQGRKGRGGEGCKIARVKMIPYQKTDGLLLKRN